MELSEFDDGKQVILRDHYIVSAPSLFEMSGKAGDKLGGEGGVGCVFQLP